MTCNKDSGNRGVRRLNLGNFLTLDFFPWKISWKIGGVEPLNLGKSTRKSLTQNHLLPGRFVNSLPECFPLRAAVATWKWFAPVWGSVSILGHTTTHWVVCPFWDTLVWVLGIHCSGDIFNSLSGVGWGVRSVVFHNRLPSTSHFFVFVCCIYVFLYLYVS